MARFEFNTAMHLAWMLREDVRGDADLQDEAAQQRFVAWWALHAAREYPAAARLDQSANVAFLSQPVALPAPGDALPLTRLMDAVWQWRVDVHRLYPYRDPAAQAAFIRWFFTCAVPEHHLFAWLPASLRRQLRQPIRPLAQAGDVPLSLLQQFVWDHRADLQPRYDLHTPAGRLGFVAWYYCHGLREFGHLPYHDEFTWRWLHSPHPVHPSLCWMAVLARAHESGDPAALLRPPGELPPHTLAEAAQWFQEHGRVRLLEPLRPMAESLPTARPGLHCSVEERPFGVNIIGFAQGELGIGEDSRMAAAALAAVGVPFSVTNITTGPNTRQEDHLLDSHFNQDAPYRYNLFCLTGFDTGRVWLELGERLFAGRVNIGYWPWELPAWPASWAAVYDFMDELWSSSLYTQASFAATAPKPVRYMPMAVSLDRMQPLPRAHFGLREDVFLFLYVFDFNSYPARKNPWGALQAFRLAFPRGDEPVGLVLKVMNARQEDPRWRQFCDAAGQDRRVTLLQQTMPRGEVLGLFHACDAYVSPHRAEGFGRTLAEALLLGKPVVATGYSGNADFLTETTGFPVSWQPVAIQPGEYPYGEGLFWAEPNLEHMAQRMQDIVYGQAHARMRADNGRQRIEVRHAPLSVGLLYKERLETLESQRMHARTIVTLP